MEYGLGIDFGTTYCAAAISTARNVEICTLGTRAAAVPSTVLVRADGEVLVGEAAERRAVEEPDRAAVAFKRRLGDPTPLVLGGTPYGAETLTSYVLASIVRQVTQQNGGPPSAIVLSHPAPFGDYKVDLLRLAARQADIGPVSFITEPEAAAVHYSTLERIDPGQVVAVYDFGGGTFDAALLRRTADGFTLIGQPEGLERIGGIDLDHAVLQHVLTSIGLQSVDLTSESADQAAAMARLRDDCRAAKEALSSDADVVIPVTLPGLMTHVRLTRAEFEAMIRPRITDTIEALRRAVRSAGVTMEQVDRILLVGGTSRVPLVREMVAAATGRPVTVDVHPKHSVAMGAAALARPRDVAETRSMSPPAPPVVPPTAPLAASPPAAPRPLGKRRAPLLGVGALVVAAIVATVVIVRSRGDDTSALSTSTRGTAGTTVAGTTAPIAESMSEPFAANLPRSTTYGSLTFSIDRFVVRTQDPAAYQSGAAAAPDGPRWAYVDGSAANALTQIPIVFASTPFSLVLADGTSLAGEQLDDDPTVPPGGSAALHLAFELGSAADLADAVVTIGDAGDEPARIALTGDQIEPVPDRDVAFAPAAVTVADPNGNPMTWGLGATSTGLDSYYDGADLVGGQTTADRRADVGMRWVNMSLTLTAGSCVCDVIAADTSMIRLLVDGTPIPPANTFDASLPPDTSVEEGLIFQYPAGATAATLVIGPPDAPDQQQMVEVTFG